MRRNDKPIHEIMQQFLQQSEKITKGVASVKIDTIHREEMGEVVNKYTREIKLRGNTLFISVVSAPLRTELTNNSKKMMDLLNNKLGSPIIEKVVIR